MGIEDLWIPARGGNDGLEKLTMKKRASLPPASFVPLVRIEIIVGSLLAGLAFLIFADLSRHVLNANILAFDRAVSEAIYAYRSPALTSLMIFISFLGGTVVLLGGSVAVFLFLLIKSYRREAVLFLFTVATGFVLNLILKYVIARTRPDIAPLIQEVFFSYPSGHSMNSFVFYALLAYLVYHLSRNAALSVVVSTGCIGLILLIGISRIYLGVHYPSDVFAGFLVGLGWVLTILVVQRTFRVYRYFRTPRK